MADYKIYRKFLSKEFCDTIIYEYEKYFDYTPRNVWKAWTLNDSEYKKYLLEIYKDITPKDFVNNWVNIAVYNEGDSLRSHRDVGSKLTIVSNLNNGYVGGDFKLGDETIKLEMGDIIVFDGSVELHGVSKIIKGTRYSLNLWYTHNNHDKPII